MLIIRRYIGPAAAIMPALLISNPTKKVWAPAAAGTPSLKRRILERDAAKFHQASRGAVHNHTSADGVFYGSFEDVFIFNLVFIVETI